MARRVRPSKELIGKKMTARAHFLPGKMTPARAKKAGKRGRRIIAEQLREQLRRRGQI